MKLNVTNSSWLEITFGVPLGSILGPLLFNIFLCNLFQFFPDLDITNQANDKTPHSPKISYSLKLVIEIFKVKMKLAPEIINEVFDIIEFPYPLRNELRFKSRSIRTARHGTETVTFAGSRIWSYILSELNDTNLLNEFRSKIQTGKPKTICANYVKCTFKESVLLYVSLFVCLLVQLGFFLFVFVLFFAFCPPFFKLQFKADLYKPHIPDKGYISILIYFLFICIFYWSTINKK